MLAAVEPIEEEIDHQRLDQHGGDDERDRSARVDGEIEDVADAEIAGDRLGEEQLEREDGADEDQDQRAVRDIEERARHALRPRRDQPLQHEAQHRHRQQDLKGEAAIESVEKLTEAGEPAHSLSALSGSAPLQAMPMASAIISRKARTAATEPSGKRKRLDRSAGVSRQRVLCSASANTLLRCSDSRRPSLSGGALYRKGENQGVSSNPGKCELQAITWVMAARSYSSPER